MPVFKATTALGMENLLASEIQNLGASDVKVVGTAVHFSGDLEMGYRACLWSRIANRVLLQLKTFRSDRVEGLYHGVRGIHWTDHLAADGTFAVDFTGEHAGITHPHYGAMKVKDAIVDQLRSLKGQRPSVDTESPQVRVNVYSSKGETTVAIDLSGESLHRRKYRLIGASAAPLKENLAAALIAEAHWPSHSRAFLDPMCGSGTLIIEAGLKASRIAPALHREYFGFIGWLGHQPAVWKKLRQEAQDQIIQNKKELPKIVGYDQDFRTVRTALNAIESAGLTGRVHIEKRDLSQCERIAETGVIITNPPYGLRIGEVEALKPVYKLLGDTFKQKFKGWDGYVFTGSSELAKVIGLKASRRIVFYNGSLECRLLKYQLF